MTLTDTIQTIGDYAFANNNLTEFVLPDKCAARIIGNYAFENNQLEYVDIRGADTVGDYAFYNNQISSIKLGGLTAYGAVASIGASAFATNKLVYLEIPDGTESIGANAFDDKLGGEVLVSPAYRESQSQGAMGPTLRGYTFPSDWELKIDEELARNLAIQLGEGNATYSGHRVILLKDTDLH